MSMKNGRIKDSYVAAMKGKALARVFYWQVAFTLIAFAVMVIVSYFIMNTAIRRHLSQNSQAALDLAMSKMETELRGPETTLRTFAEEVRQSIILGEDADNIRELLRSFNTHLLFHSKDGTTPVTLFGIFYTLGPEPVFLHNDGWTPFAGYDAKSRPWYWAAMAGGGSPMRSGLYLDFSMKKYAFAIAQSIHDESGRLLGIVSLQVPIDLVGEIVINEAAKQGGFGMILGHDLMVHTHTNRSFVGMQVPDPALPFSIFYDSFIKGEDILERPIISFTGEPSFAFLRKTEDGWYYGTIVPRAPYLESITNIWYALIALGIAAAIFLIFTLAKTEAKKNRMAALTGALNKMSEMFLTQSGKAFEDVMGEGGFLLAELAMLDRFEILRNTVEGDVLYMSQVYRWEKASGGTTKVNEKFVHVAYNQVAPEWERMFKEGKTLNGPIRLMPRHESAILNSIGARSALLAPIHINGVPWGFVLFEDHKRERPFDSDLEETMKSAAFLFVNAILRAELESQLASERDYTQEIVDAAPIGLNIWDDNVNITGCNDAVETIFGCTKQYYLEHFDEFSPEYQPDGVKSIVKVSELMDRVRKGETIVSDWMHRSASGEPIPCEITMTRLAYNDKNVVLVYLYDLRNMKKMEAAVLDAEQMRALIDAVPLSCTLIDKDVNILTCNQTAVEVFKLSKKDDIKGLFTELVPEYQPDGSNSLESASLVVKKAFEKGYAFYTDWMHKSMDGEPLPCEVTLVRIKYGDSDVVAAYIRDMRADREAKAKLHEAEERTQIMLNATPLACSLLDKNYDCLDCNEEAVKLFGVSTKQEYLDTYQEFWPQRQPDGRDSFEEGGKLIQRAFECGYLCFEWIYVIGGELVPCEVTLVRVEYGSEHILAAYTRDQRREKVAEAKAREADERALLMLENTPLIVMVWDENIQILDCNQEAVRILGLPSKKEYVENFYKLMPEYQPCGEVSSEKAQKAISQAFSEGSSQIEFTMIHHTGEAIPFEVSLFRISYKGKDTVISYGQDLRERNAAIAKMREADEKARDADEWSMLMLDAMPLGSGVWTRDGKMAVCNEEAARLFDLENKNEFIERFGELSPEYQPDGRPSLETAIGYVGKAFEEGYCRFEWTHKKPNGEPLPVEVFLIRAKYRDDYRVIGYFRDLREIKESIAKLREADVRAQLMLEEAPLTIMLWDKNANILDCNQVAVRTFGVSYKEEYISKFIEWAPQYQPNGMTSIEVIQKELAKVFETGSARFDWTHHHGVTGELIPFEITWVRVVYKDEYVALSYAQDLRERNAAIAKMREADERSQIMFDAAPLAGCLFDSNIKMFDCNEELVRMCGLPSKEYFLQNSAECVPEYQPDGTSSMDALFEKVKTTLEKGYNQFEFTHRKISGELFPVRSTLLCVKYRGEDMVAAYFRDLTEQKAREQLTKEVMEKSTTLTAILDTAPDLIFVKDLDSRYIRCNKRFETLMGCTCDAIIGKGDAEGLNAPPEVAAAFIAEDKEVFNTKQMTIFEDYLVAGDGTKMLFETVKAPLIINDEMTGLVGIARDISQRKKMEEETQKAYEEAMKAYAAAESALEAKNLFVANMNHEMRTPMNVIVGLTELLLDEEDVTAKVRDTLHKINTAGTTLMGLISDVLDISKVDAGKMELAPVKYDVASFLSDIVTLNVIRIEEKPIIFNLDIDENLPRTLHGDDLRVKQILNNLLSNAFKYTKAGSVTLNVDCKRDGNIVWTSFCVTDTGIGIRSQDIGRLFTEYHQVDAKANRRIEGTGLGLSITKRIVELMGGQVSVESKYGRGTTFHVRIKQEFVSSETIGKENAENLRSFQYLDKKKQAHKKFVRANLSYAHALVVDDFPTNLDVAAGMLRKYKMQVDCVTSGQAAIDLIKAGTPAYDAVFMDHMMPEMDGIEAVHAIRALESGYAKDMPIIALTANAVAGNEQMFLENGFDAFLPKPFNVMALDAVIQRWVRDKSKE